MQTAAVKRLPISSWSMEDRPSDKMIELGTSALTDAELLSIVIGSGTHKASAVDIAKHLLADHQNNLHELGKAEFNEICETEGIGTSIACRIMAAIELGKRRQMAWVNTLTCQRPVGYISSCSPFAKTSKAKKPTCSS